MNANCQVVLLHGSYGSPAVNWLPWLANQLQLEGVAVSVPRFPTPEGQNLKNWTEAFFQQVAPLHPRMVLVGHSMGAGMILRLLEMAETPVLGCVLVGGWTGLLGSPEFDPIIHSFFETPFDWHRIRSKAGKLNILHGDNDPYVPLGLGKKLAADLDMPLTVVPGGGHLNAEAGYREFPLLFKIVSEIIAKE